MEARDVTVRLTDGDDTAILHGVSCGRRRRHRWSRQAAAGDESVDPHRQQSRSITGGDAMSLSSPFILRPIATSLLMAGLLLAGAVALPAAAGFRAAGSGLSDDSGGDLLPGREPGRDGVGRHRAARAPIRTGAGAQADDVEQLGRGVGHHAAVRARLEHRRRRAGSTGGDQRVGHLSADRSSEPAHLQQDQPGRRADPHAGPDLEHAAAVESRRLRRHAIGAEDFATLRRRAGQHQRRPEARGQDSGEPDVDFVVRAHVRRRPAPRLPRRMSTRPKAISTVPIRRTRSAPTISCSRATATARWSSPTATARPSICRTSPPSSTMSRTSGRRPG